MKKYLILAMAVVVVAMVVGLLSIGPATAVGPVTSSGPTITSGTADGDTIQSGDQTTPDVGPAASEAGAESVNESKVEESGENLPNGGHADPQGVDTQHDFQGVE